MKKCSRSTARSITWSKLPLAAAACWVAASRVESWGSGVVWGGRSLGGRSLGERGLDEQGLNEQSLDEQGRGAADQGERKECESGAQHFCLFHFVFLFFYL